ncbi:MAG TPA: exo-alpha-sialidase [Phycisphaerae bacterium]|nr:exo-alpha-sialidase [Phycisphaerae bacterium]
MNRYALMIVALAGAVAQAQPAAAPAHLRNALASHPDYIVYVPGAPHGPDGSNQHFLVTPTKAGTFLAFWTMSTRENNPDQHVAMSRSEDRGRTWSRPVTVAGGPADAHGRMASWQFPVVVPETGRIYLFWNQNVGITDAREDTTGALAYKWSDDDGRTWSDVHTLQIRKSAISNPEPGSPENWVVYQAPIITSRGEVIVGFTRWTSKTIQPEGGLFDRDSEIWFLRFDNLLTERDGSKLTVTTLPEGQHGLRVPRPDKPAISVAQEPTIQELSDGRFVTIMRTRTGYIYYALSNDRGQMWDRPRPLRYRPGGEKVKQPLAPCPLYKLRDGRFVLIFHNNDGSAFGGTSPSDSRKNRRPVFVAVGREIADPDHPLVFTRPRLLADNGGIPDGPVAQTQIGTYPSLFEYEGKVYFWYPDRKHYLLGKELTEELLDDREVRDWKAPPRASLRGCRIQVGRDGPAAPSVETPAFLVRAIDDLRRLVRSRTDQDFDIAVGQWDDGNSESFTLTARLEPDGSRERVVVRIEGAPAGLKYGLAELIHHLRMAPADVTLEVPLEIRKTPKFSARGMYAHLHWAYNRPYALRSWTLEDWQRYIDLLACLGFNTIQIWPMMELLPHPLSPEDQAYLKRYAEIVDYAHQQRGMKVILGSCPNNITEDARGVPIEKREYFDFEKRLDPGDRAALARILEYRSDLYKTVPHADGYWVIDSDPGGWKGSPSREFVEILKGHRELIDRYGRRPTEQPLIYWMWYGWGTGSVEKNWRDTIGQINTELHGPWQLLVCLPGHLEACKELALLDKAVYFPYNLLETEPAGPLTELRFIGIAEAAQIAASHGITAIQGNTQTPLAQLPNIAALAGAAWGVNPATEADEVLDRLARGLLSREPETLKKAWLALSEDRPEPCFNLAVRLRELAGDPSAKGPLAVLIGDWQPRILEDLAAMLEIRAHAVRFARQVEANAGDAELVTALTDYFMSAASYLERTGYRGDRIVTHESYRGVVTAALKRLNGQLGDEAVQARILGPALAAAKKTRSPEVCDLIAESVLEKRK